MNTEPWLYTPLSPLHQQAQFPPNCKTNFRFSIVLFLILTLNKTSLFLLINYKEFPAKNAWALYTLSMSSRHDERMLRHKVHRRLLVLHHAAWQVVCFVLSSTVICCALYLFRRICNRIDTRVIETHTTPDQGHVSWQTNRSVSLRIVNTQLYILMLRHTNAVFLKTFFAQKSLMKSTLRHHHAGYIYHRNWAAA